MTKSEFTLDALIPMDPNLRHGTLKNGLRYAVLPNQYPKGRIHMQLLVHVGSIFEDDDQRGLAHITEHMAFNGSSHFSGLELIDFLESLGMRYGAHINAMTSADFTLYKLEVPASSPETTQTALQVLRDWASELLFLPEEIERERKVALEEWRMYRMSQQRVMEQIRPHFFANTPYADRLPIGTEHSLRTFSHSALKRFYADWYRPELMTVLIVGDMDAEGMVSQIDHLFSDMSAKTPARPLPDMSWPRPDSLSFTSAYDSELPHPMISILSPLPAEDTHNHQSYLKLMTRSIISRVCSERFLLQSVKPDAPFYQAGASYSRIHPKFMVDSINAFVSHDRFQEGCAAMVQEINRLRQYGVTQEELDRHVQKIITDLESGYLERDSMHSAHLLNELLSFAKDGEPITGIEYELQMAKTLLPLITVEDVQVALQTWLSEAGSLCYAVANDQETVGAEALEAYHQHAMTLPVHPPEMQHGDIRLMSEVPSSGHIKSHTIDKETGVHQYELSNGGQVWVYPTSHEADSIHFQSYSWGGTSLLADEDVKAALFVPYFVELSGLGPHDYATMMRLTSTLQTRVEPFCDQNRHGFVGGTVLKDIESMFQLLHLQVMAPRFEQAAFDRNIAVNKELLENREKNPEYLFSKEINRHSWASTARHGFLSFKDFENASLPQGESIYRRLWGHAQQLYCFVGNIDLPTIEKLIGQYIATLPAPRPTTVQNHPNERLFEGRFQASYPWLNEPKAVVKSRRYIPSESYEHSKSLSLRLFSMVAEQRLRKKLRDELGQVYTVGVHATQQRHPICLNLRYEFGCDPNLVSEVTAQSESVLQDFIDNPIQIEEFNLAKSQVLRSLEVQAQSNPVWLRRLIASHQYTGGVSWAFKGEQRIEDAHIQEVMNLVRPILTSPNHITMQLGPKSEPSA